MSWMNSGKCVKYPKRKIYPEKINYVLFKTQEKDFQQGHRLRRDIDIWYFLLKIKVVKQQTNTTLKLFLTQMHSVVLAVGKGAS